MIIAEKTDADALHASGESHEHRALQIPRRPQARRLPMKHKPDRPQHELYISEEDLSILGMEYCGYGAIGARQARDLRGYLLRSDPPFCELS